MRQASWSSTLIRYLFYPVTLLASLGSFEFFRHRVSADNLSLLPIIIGVVAVVVVHVTEQLFPYRAQWNKSHDDGVTDFVFTNLILPTLSKGVEIFLAWFFVDSVGSLLSKPLSGFWPHQWSIWAQLIMVLLLCEFIFYWVHRLFHTKAILWDYHAIHHSIPRVYWNNAGRFHPIDLTLTWLLYFAAFSIFGISSEVFAAFLVLNAVTGLLEHANVDFKAGPLNRIFNTAELHRWHHSTIVKESSTNFGKVLSIWDQVFGSYFLPTDREVEVVGVDTEPVPLKALPQMTYPLRQTWARIKSHRS